MHRVFESEFWLPRPREKVFEFFADAANLGMVTPEWLKFTILTPPPIVMRKGALIDYRLSLRGWPIRWRTEITAWDPPRGFVDEQRRGPYRVWIHRHTFEESRGGTLAHDRVEYAAPGGWLIEKLFVERDIHRIFAFRRSKLEAIFAEPG